MRRQKKGLSSWHHRILSTLNLYGPQSRTDLARRLGLSKASITSFARDLTEDGLLDERERVFGSGRPAIALALRGNAASFVGISLTTTPAQIVLVNACGHSLRQAAFTLPSDAEAGLEKLYAMIKQIRDEAAREKGALMGIGITAAAPAASCSPSSIAMIKTWRETDLCQRLSRRVGLPIYVENDVNSLLVCAYLFDETKQTNLSLAFVGEHIASGHIVNHRFHYTRYSNGGGWLARYPVRMDTGACPHLAQRCVDLQAVISIPAMLSLAAQEGLKTDLKSLIALAASGHEGATSIFQQAGGTLGVVLAQMVQFLDIVYIIVIVEPQLMDTPFVQALKNTFESFVDATNGLNVRLVVAPFDAGKMAVAASSVAAQQLLYGSEFPQRDQLMTLR